jgi:hypothetical protein
MFLAQVISMQPQEAPALMLLVIVYCQEQKAEKVTYRHHTTFRHTSNSNSLSVRQALEVFLVPGKPEHLYCQQGRAATSLKYRFMLDSSSHIRRDGIYTKNKGNKSVAGTPT